jgi:16S rRNA (guanine527-N7)-methyltransferase
MAASDPQDRAPAPAPAPFHAALLRESTSWSVPLSAGQTDALRQYSTLLMTWTARINLTGAVSLENLAAEHLPDSFALAAVLPGAEPLRIVDVGSGGGLPAIPLALLRPHLQIQLIEPIAKKAAFLRTAVRELGLAPRVTVTVGRAESLLPLAPPSAFDVAISRATLAPLEWISLAVQLVRPGGRAFILASASSDPGANVAPFDLVSRRPYSGDRRVLIELLKPAEGPRDR